MSNPTIYSDQVRFENPQKHVWQDSASCAQTDPDAFFPEKGESYAFARKICGSCLVRSNCLDKTIDDESDADWRDRFGMFAGMTPKERYTYYLEQNGLEEDEEENEAQIAA